MTYSVLHFDSKDKKIISAICSNWVGIQVCRVTGKSGVVHTQSWADYVLAHRVLDGLDEGLHPDEAIAQALKLDSHPQIRQLLVCDFKGRQGLFTGAGCIDENWHARGKNTVVAGNMLSSKQIVQDLLAKITYTAEARAEVAVFNAMEYVHIDTEGEAGKRGDRSLSLKSIPADYRDIDEYQLDITMDSALNGSKLYDRFSDCIRTHFDRDKKILK